MKPGRKANKQMGWYGNFRGKVVEVDIDGNDYGAIRVFVPDVLSKDFNDEIDENSTGIIAYPANNPMGGYDSSDSESSSSYQAALHVPLKNSWVWVWFEGGDLSRAFYGNGVQIKDAKVPPENRGVAEPHKVYTVAKTKSGRAIVICDSEDQARVEITGKKGMLSGTGGGEGGVYDVDGNMTTILLDERGGSEKILLRSHTGDYFNFDITNRRLHIEFLNDVFIKSTAGSIKLQAEQDILLKSNKEIALDTKDIYEKSSNQHQIDSGGGGFSVLSQGNIRITSQSGVYVKGSSTVAIDSDVMLVTQTGVASGMPAPAVPAKPDIVPIGTR